MKQDEVLALIIEKTDSGDIEWDSNDDDIYLGKTKKNIEDYQNAKNRSRSMTMSISEREAYLKYVYWNGVYKTYEFSHDFINQSLKRNGDEIISGILVLRGLHVAIQQQLKQRELDKLSGIYHEILTE